MVSTGQRLWCKLLTSKFDDELSCLVLSLSSDVISNCYSQIQGDNIKRSLQSAFDINKKHFLLIRILLVSQGTYSLLQKVKAIVVFSIVMDIV